MNIACKNLTHHELKLASSVGKPSRLIASSIDAVDYIFEGGIKLGEITELGIPAGMDGRKIIYRFIRQAAKYHGYYSAWINCCLTRTIYPLNMYAYGVDPTRIFFANSINPTKDLYHLFLSEQFKIIVIDSPTKFSKKDQNFLLRCARRNETSIILIKDHFLSNKYGNIWSAKRINIYSEPKTNELVIYSMKGAAKIRRLKGG